MAGPVRRSQCQEHGWWWRWCCSCCRCSVAGSSSIRWLALPIAALAIAAMARRPGLGLIAIIGAALLVPYQFGTGREVSLNLAVLLVPTTFAIWVLIMVRRRDIHLPRSRTTTPLLLFILASLLSLVAGNAYWDPRVPRPSNLLLIQLGRMGHFCLLGRGVLVDGQPDSRREDGSAA